MKVFSLRTFTPWAIALLSLAVLAGCGSDSNPINPTAAGPVKMLDGSIDMPISYDIVK